MARPKKNTVDYFPHDCHWSKALEIFINKHANEGYAFYYRLFEQLGVSPDHKYNCSKPIDNQYLASKTGVTEEKMSQYIKDLVSIGVIDEDYWKKKIIWVQSFVDSVADVYKSRTTQLPTKDGSLVENFAEEEFSAEKQSLSVENRGFPARNSQSKGKETELNKKILNKKTGFLTKCDICDYKDYVDSKDTCSVCKKDYEHGRMAVTTL